MINDQMTNDHAEGFPVEDAILERLHDELGVRAGEAGLLDVAYRIVDSPIGRLLLAATETGLVYIAFEAEDFDRVLADLATKIGPRMLAASTRLEPVAEQLAEYFGGERHEFDLPLDHRLASGFRRDIQERLARIDYGHTLTYKELALQVGNPGAVRAIGSACATNPLPLVLPCHRVLRSDGGLGGYRGGLAAKELLLDLERAA